MNAPLKNLQDRLKQALSGRPRQLAWGDLPAMQKSLEAARLALQEKRGMTREQRIARGVLAFRLQGRDTDFVSLKYACLGVNQPVDWDSRRLLEDEAALKLLLHQVAALPDPRRFAACSRGLLAVWQQREKTPPPPAAARNLEHLRQFLHAGAAHLPPKYRPE
jgi:hypothetical protein